MKLKYSHFRSWGENEKNKFPYAYSSYVLVNTKTGEVESVVVTAISNAKRILEALSDDVTDILGFWVGQYRSDIFKIEKDEQTKANMIREFKWRWATFEDYL